jgi:outer membrane murein-binding lipoprotein Lpp
MKITESSIQNDAIEKEIASKHIKLEDLKKTLTKLEFQQDDAEKKVKQTEEQLSDAKQNLKDAKYELAIQERFEKEAALKVQKLNIEVDRLKSDETVLKSSIKSLEVLAKQLNKQLDAQDGDTAANEEKYRDLWYPVPFPDLSPVAGSPNEQQLLKNTADYIKGQNLYFPQRVLYAFHTALKIGDISPLVVLAGISGTGKSELPRRYAEGMGLHFVILAVQPRWDSPQDLFGFYNYLEKRYKATELARAMVQFELYNRTLWPLPTNWDHSRSDRVLLVLLDEMNLARVEYYFSEFLSRLETRRGINQENKKERAKAEIALEMGSLRKGEEPIRLFPGHNILFTGTMNEDETTQALSDKVLDRACVMRFGRPKRITEEINAPKKNPSENGLTLDQWNSWLNGKLSSSDKNQINTWINELNDAMDEIHRPFAYRVSLAIQSYVANYPDWVPNRIKIAMADQIEQRIMPKLRGIELADAGGSIHKIQSIIEYCEDQNLLNAFKQGSSNQQVFIWRGIDRTE